MIKKQQDFFSFWLAIFVISLAIACNSNPVAEAQKDKPYEGAIHISVDETFKPVIEEQLKMYKSTFPNATINVSYKPEVACFKDLQSDSTRMIITARKLDTTERKFFESNLRFKPTQDVVAYDAVTVLLNKNNKDSIYTIEKLRNILSGKNPVMVVMDGNNATSTVRYIKDSVLRGLPFGSNVVAAKNSKNVIEIISENESAIGFVGLSWVGDKYDKEQQKTLVNTKFALVECTKCNDGTFAKPSQYTITFSQYPLARPLYCIVKENYPGLGTGFYNFLSLERGQLIFRRAFLAPAKMAFMKSKTNI
ncbi:MAG: PstS family phosphate ABC transporter substrate-binding protein [Chitinophagaceae bacterium]